MRKYIKRLLNEVIKEEKGLFSMYVEDQTSKTRNPLGIIPVITTDYVPRVGEFVNVMVNTKIYVFEVVEVNYIFHNSSQEFQEGTIIVKETGRMLKY